MPEPCPLSVHLLTRNSGATLRAALASLPPCAEILLVDGGSTDSTLEVAREWNARVLPEVATGSPDFASLRNRALAETTQPWILIQDSDERLSPELRSEIAAISETSEPCAYLVPRRYVDAEGTVIEFASTYPNERIFFFHRSLAEQWVKPVHERIALKAGAPIRRLAGCSLAPLPTPEEFKEKNRRYIAIEVANTRHRGWIHWLRHRVAHTLRSRLIATLRLLRIWLMPRRGKRLPLVHEWLRFWYAWTLIVETCPWKTRRSIL